MIPVLYDKYETEFNTNGLGRLSGAIECLVTEERNGLFELEMVYAQNAPHYSEIELNSVIKAAPNDSDNEQLFVVYSIDRYMSGTAAIHARHISYRLLGIPVKPYTATGAANAMAALTTNAVVAPGFTFETDIESDVVYTQKSPQSAKACLGGIDGSILDTYGGEYKWDNFKVSLLQSRGEDNGVEIRYGKNLTDLRKSEDTDETYNGVFPFWYREGEDAVYPTTASVNPDLNYPYPHYKLEDFTGNYDSKPTAAQLKNRADTEAAGLTHPGTTLAIKMASLWQAEKHDLIQALEKLRLCDKVSVYYEALGVSVKSTVIKTVYNVLLDRYEELHVGEIRSNLYETLSNLTDDMSDSATQGNLKGIIATKSISIGSVTVGANSTANVTTSTTNVEKSGYYVVDVVRMRSSDANISFSNASLSRGVSSTTVNYVCRNNSGSSVTATISAIILYVKSKYAVSI